MKPKLILLSSIALLGSLTLAGCSSPSGGEGAVTQIGILQFGSFGALIKAKDGFVETLEASEIKDKVNITVSNPEADSAVNASMASTLASTSDLLYGIATPSACALKNAVDSLGVPTPILFSAVTNAIGANLVANLDRPEGNCTGVLDIGPIADELDILSKFPSVNKVASFFTATEVNSVYQVGIAEEWMDAHSIAHTRVTITNASEIGAALAGIPSDVDAVFLPTDDTIANSIQAVRAANEERVDKLIIVGSDTGMADSTVFSMGVDYYRCGVQAAEMAIQLLKDSKEIAEIPVETCDVHEIVVNQTWANRLGIEIPAEVLAVPGVRVI